MNRGGIVPTVDLLAVQTRAGRIERHHYGSAVLVDAQGAVLQEWGDPEHPTYFRSATKPVQAAAVVATGAWKAFGLGDEELAVACGSHAGEAGHRARVARILEAVALGADALRCGVHRPWSRHSIRVASGPDPLGNNCSGKHAAMLAACVHMGWPQDYRERVHPLQQAIHARLGGPSDLAADGCGVPTYWGSIVQLARIFQALPRDEAGARVLSAMAAHPWMVSGTGQFCTDLGSATGGDVVGKYGALGVYAAIHRPSGHAMALKVADGDEHAAKTTALWIMAQSGWLPGDGTALAQHMEPPNVTNDGALVGSVRCVL